MSFDSDQLNVLASERIYGLYSTNKFSTPISALGLFAQVLATAPKQIDLTQSFSLLDLPSFEQTLESLSRHWEHGEIRIARDDFGVTVLEIALGNAVASARSRKRKRVVDEDADSAAGDEDDPSLTADLSNGSRDPSERAGLSGTLQEVCNLLQRGTARTRLLAEQYRSPRKFEPICPKVTKDECSKSRRTSIHSPWSICDKIHFRPLIRPHTDTSLGHCSYLNTCYSEPTYAQSPSLLPFQSNNARQGSGNLPSGLGAGGQGKAKAPCRYLHFEVDWDERDTAAYKKTVSSESTYKPYKLGIGLGPDPTDTKQLPAQWINCDVRKFDCSVLGKFHVLMLDPPWDIHMNLPYGTMTDDEMKAMPIPTLQDEGIIFLWVTGRAMEVGRECLRVWGYTRVDEIIWLKTNQLQRIIRTGRTGHWLNHTKEHMLVGIKTHTDSEGNLLFPSWVNRGLDTDVIVSEVRETSRKPEEQYGLIERMCPGGRKIEIFGRQHNTRPGWLTLGNQLGEDRVYEKDLVERIKEKYPEHPIKLSVVE